jgi:hypothetical protein
VGLGDALAKRLSIVRRVLGKNDFQIQYPLLLNLLYRLNAVNLYNRTIR